MAVIAKMVLGTVKDFGTDSVSVSLSTIYDQTLALEANEDVRFTKATPWGNAEMTLPKRVVPEKWGAHDYWANQVYLLFHAFGDMPKFDETLFALEGICNSITDMGYTKQIDLGASWRNPGDAIPEDKRIGKAFNVKLGIDNPHAVSLFEPTKFYWVSAFDAEKFTLDEALALARA